MTLICYNFDNVSNSAIHFSLFQLHKYDLITAQKIPFDRIMHCLKSFEHFGDCRSLRKLIISDIKILEYIS